MLAALDAKRLPLSTAYPVQALRLGALTLLALPGEVVVDYALNVRDKYGPHVITAAYASFLPGYIPSLRLQREGGYEAGDSMMYFLQPGWFTDQVEPLVLAAIDRVLRRLP
jgi:neutral ceramidase